MRSDLAFEFFGHPTQEPSDTVIVSGFSSPRLSAVWCAGCGVLGMGCGVRALGCGVSGVWAWGAEVQGMGCRGCGAWGAGCVGHGVQGVQDMGHGGCGAWGAGHGAGTWGAGHGVWGTGHGARCTHMSAQPWSPMISMALTHSPADMYISAAALGSLMLRAQSACFVIRLFFSVPSPDPRNSCQ